jgi:putative endonuclease
VIAVMWYVYILQCADDTLYTGITTDVQRRLLEHNGQSGNKKGAKYTRSRRPLKIIFTEVASSKEVAIRREMFIKKLSRSKKMQLYKNNHDCK